MRQRRPDEIFGPPLEEILGRDMAVIAVEELFGPLHGAVGQSRGLVEKVLTRFIERC